MNGPLASQALTAAIRTRSGHALHSVVTAPITPRAANVDQDLVFGAVTAPNIPRGLRAQVLVRIGVRQLTDRPLMVLADYGLLPWRAVSRSACSFT